MDVREVAAHSWRSFGKPALDSSQICVCAMVETRGTQPVIVVSEDLALNGLLKFSYSYLSPKYIRPMFLKLEYLLRY